MTPKQRMLTAIRGQAHCVPVALPYLRLYLSYVIDRISDLTWAHMAYGSVEDRVRADVLAYEVLGCDWILVHSNPPLEELEGRYVEQEGDMLFLVDGRKGTVRELPRTRPMPPPVKPMASSEVGNVEDFPPPPSAEEMIARGQFAAAQRIVSQYGEEVFIYGEVRAPFPAPYSTLGVEGMLIALKEDRELYRRLVGYRQKATLEVIRAWGKLGVDGLWIEEWLASADVISEADYLTFAYPGEKALIEATQRNGMVDIFHFCGDVMPRLKHIRGLRPTCLAVEESKKGFEIDIGQVRKEMGEEICLFGNVDVLRVLQNGDQDLWRREIGRQVQSAGRNGRFVMSFGSPITPETPLERLRAFIRLAKEMTRYESRKPK